MVTLTNFLARTPRKPHQKHKEEFLAMKLTKRFLSALLVLAMVLTVCPVIPFAATAAETKAETEALVLRAGELEKKIDERLLTGFKRIRKNARNGLAVVKIERDSCGGCHAKIPAQQQLDIRTRKKIIVCEFCGRILVDQDM